MSTVANFSVKLFNWLKFKEFLRGTECWNCKTKNSCLSYQATKDDAITVTACTKKS